MTQAEKTPYFLKRRIALTHYLVGRQYHRALKALAFAEKYHTGVRKDGKTPEFQHMLEVALHIITLRDLIDEEGAIVSALLHDVREDYNVPHNTIAELFGEQDAQSIEVLSKVIDGVKKPLTVYFAELAKDVNGSLTKGCDRVHNFQSMPGVFSYEKQQNYLEEGRFTFCRCLRKHKNSSHNSSWLTKTYAII